MALPINLLAVLVSAVVAFVLGMLWFGPLFGKVWTKELGFTMPSKEEMKKMQGAMMKSYALVFLGAIVMAFVLAHNVLFGSAYLSMDGIASGLQAGFWNWLGFVAVPLMGSVLWEGRSWKFYGITAGYYLVDLLIMGSILASWPF